MSVSSSSTLKVGVTADKLFDDILYETRDQYELMDQRTGKPTGKMSQGEEWVVGVLPDGTRIELKGNCEFRLIEELENRLNAGPYKPDVFRIEMSSDYYNEDRTCDDVFAGITVIHGDGMENNNILISQELIESRKKLCAELLKIVGYDGPIEIALVTSCG